MVVLASIDQGAVRPSTSVGRKSEENGRVPEAMIETKLLVPRLRHQTVLRTRLEELLGRGGRNDIATVELTTRLTAPRTSSPHNSELT
jgi:hypothetical protein